MRVVERTRRRRRPSPPKPVRTANSSSAIRSLVRRGTRSDHSPRVARKGVGFEEPTVCERCAAIFLHKTWRRGRRIAPELLLQATRDVCPACRQVARHEFFGSVLIQEPDAASQEAILRRVANVARRAGFTQPERRIVDIRRQGGGIEVHTTSQKLAHRMVHELVKAFGGRAHFEWSDRDGRLLATWVAG